MSVQKPTGSRLRGVPFTSVRRTGTRTGFSTKLLKNPTRPPAASSGPRALRPTRSQPRLVRAGLATLPGPLLHGSPRPRPQVPPSVSASALPRAPARAGERVAARSLGVRRAVPASISRAISVRIVASTPRAACAVARGPHPTRTFGTRCRSRPRLSRPASCGPSMVPFAIRHLSTLDTCVFWKLFTAHGFRSTSGPGTWTRFAA